MIWCGTFMICNNKVTQVWKFAIYSSFCAAQHSETKVLFMQLKLATLLRSSLIG